MLSFAVASIPLHRPGAFQHKLQPVCLYALESWGNTTRESVRMVCGSKWSWSVLGRGKGKSLHKRPDREEEGPEKKDECRQTGH